MTDEELQALVAELASCGELDNLRMPFNGLLCDLPEEVIRLRAENARLREALEEAIRWVPVQYAVDRLRDALEGK